MRVLLNLIWFFLCGLWMAIGYAIAGVVCCLLIVTIPFGLASFRIAAYALWPFGRAVRQRSNSGAASAIGNLVWLVVAGWWLALAHVFTGIAQCVTIIGIPLGLANFKLIPVSLFPLGAEVVDSDTYLPSRA